MSLTRSDAVIALGKRLVVYLKANDDLLGGWMAHHLAELITAAETTPPETRSAAYATCSAAVLEIWRHRNTLPPHLRPLGELEPILATLATLSLDPDNFRYNAKALHSAAVANADGATKQWLEVAFGVDYSARVLIGSALRAAAASADESAEDWVELAQKAGGDDGSEVVLLRFFNPNVGAEESESKRRENDLKDQVRRLRSFVKVANAAADDMQSRLDKLAKD